MQTAKPWGWGNYGTNQADGERKLQEGEFQLHETDVPENVEICKWTPLLWVNLSDFTVKQKQPQRISRSGPLSGEFMWTRVCSLPREPRTLAGLHEASGKELRTLGSLFQPELLCPSTDIYFGTIFFRRKNPLAKNRF